MESKIKGSFWTDDGIGGLDPNLKLAALWVITNPEVTVLGMTKVSLRHFTFDTGLPATELDRLCTTLPQAFTYRTGLVVAHNFIHHQLGSGEKLRLNSIFKAVCRAFEQVREDWLKKLLLSSCPELLDSATPPPPPYDGVREGEGEREGLGKGESKGKGEGTKGCVVEDADLLAYAATWPGESASATPPMPLEWVKEFLKRTRSRVLMPGDLTKAAIAAWRVEHRAWRPGLACQGNFSHQTGRLPGAPPPPNTNFMVKLERI